MSVNVAAIRAVARKEFEDQIRNRWILAVTVIFVVLTIAASYLTGGQTAGNEVFGGLEGTVVTLISLSSLLIPLIAIMLGYATISGEVESGAMGLVLSYPVSQGEVLIGKYLGLSAVLVVSTIAGFGAGGVVIAAVAGTANAGAYLVFILLAILLGLLYLSLSISFSAYCKRRSTSIASGILLFFWSTIYGTIVLGIHLSTGGSIEDFFGPEVTFPDWLWRSLVLSPMDMHQQAVLLAFGITETFGYNVDPPAFITIEYLVAVQLVWTIVPLGLAYIFFLRRDI
ncbi:membrane protein NosY [Salinarchaeum sp. Harcht-Bsk1]|uniref:ABC transporter permease subunit n=1 Tax=Salinarchaeum sp. Harcht-Bsk1 TaxID=1333523 RepID=UPI00034248CB|nr:ABC transporter permease subunit [Salinarchaeum sp. Harcht-Bsk1]AGN02299.1 membrane protein NosY [Salinarchaeum sp. Harcht-Bsk1]